MTLTPIRVRGKKRSKRKRAAVESEDGAAAKAEVTTATTTTATTTAATKDTSRATSPSSPLSPRERERERAARAAAHRRRPVISFDQRFPLEVLERIFLLSRSVALPRASPRLGRALSGRPTLVACVLDAFRWTWARSYGVGDPGAAANNVDDDVPSEASQARYQSDVLACPWATADLLLDAQARFLAQNRRGSDNGGDDDGDRRRAAVVHAEFAAALDGFVQDVALGQWTAATERGDQDGSAPHSITVAATTATTTTTTYVASGTRIPRRLLQGGLWPAVRDGGGGGGGGDNSSGTSSGTRPGAKRPRRRTRYQRRDTVARLFWLVQGGARLQPADSWEITQAAVDELVRDVSEGGDGGEDDDEHEHEHEHDEKGVFSPDLHVACWLALLDALHVFDQQWPRPVLAALMADVRQRRRRRRKLRWNQKDGADAAAAAFQRSHTHAVLDSLSRAYLHQSLDEADEADPVG